MSDLVEAVARDLQRAWDKSDTLPPFVFTLAESQSLARAAISVIEGREGWQPIETAPKDGTKVDVWTNLDERWTNVWWEPAKQDWLHWWVDAWGGMGAQRLGAAPTHWRPLPEPPAIRSGDEG